jgi:CubicO group peptidase (beta-lactamase class C family)
MSPAAVREQTLQPLVQRTLLVLALLLLGCSGRVRQLHALSGNEFTLFPQERSKPPPSECGGSMDDRWACLTRQAQRMREELELAGGFAVALPDGTIRAFAQGDALNQGVNVIDENTRFPVASVSKMFLAAAVVSLGLEGVLDLHQPIARYLPELSPERGVGQATLHQLLTHTSGLGNPEQCEQATDDLGEQLTRHGQLPLWSPPGVLFNYSNVGYSFAALVSERVSGKPFEQLVQERVLVPAGISGASYGPDRAAVKGHRESPVVPRCRGLWPSGGLLLSVRELARWAQVLASPEGSPLGRPLIEQLTALHVPSEERPGSGYGYGVRRFVHGGLHILHHPGKLQDFTAVVAWSPERQLGVAAVANTSKPVVFAASFRALSTLLDLPPDWQPPPGPLHPLSAYVGVYEDAAGTLGTLRVSVEEGNLMIDYLDGPPPLLPPNFRFVFLSGATLAAYVVTPVGVGRRRAEPAAR